MKQGAFRVLSASDYLARDKGEKLWHTRLLLMLALAVVLASPLAPLALFLSLIPLLWTLMSASTAVLAKAFAPLVQLLPNNRFV